MSVLFLLIPVSLLLSALFVYLCIASIRGGQFDDLESPRWRILFDGRTENKARASEAIQASISEEKA